METNRIALTLALACAAHTALATGDFYEASLYTLPEYLQLDQLPAKTLGDILRETGDAAPPPAKAREPFQIMPEVLKLAEIPAADAVKKIDALLIEARMVQPKHGPGLANLLHDLRDLFFTGKASAKEAGEYIKWRAEHTRWFGFSWNDGTLGRVEVTNEDGEKRDEEIEKKIADASPAMKPHWLYLHGALGFKSGEDTSSRAAFESVVKEFPQHPRAEAAQFMAARCALSQSRSIEEMEKFTPGHGYTSDAAKRSEAQKLFEQYVAKYPNGRFAGDALGWLACVAYDAEDYAGALVLYLKQASLSGRPELLHSASGMVEICLSHAITKPDDKAFARIAKDPRLAQALVYLALNTSESDNFNSEIDEVPVVTGWRKALLPRLAAALTSQETAFSGETWKPRYAAALALSASGSGDQAKAQKLLGLAGASVNDDLLFARGVVFQRAKQPKEAIAALQELIQKYPNSPLAKGARLRLGLALVDDHQGGEAVLALQKLIPERKSAEAKPVGEEEEEDDSFHMPSLGPIYDVETVQVGQIIDVIFNFASHAELAAVTEKADLDDSRKLVFREVLAQRHLAREQFAEAKKYMTPAQWRLSAAAIEELSKQAQAAKPPATAKTAASPAYAEACLKLADAWAAARGKLLTYPLDTDERRRSVYEDHPPHANDLRVASAAALGYTGNLAIELENRDELRHAFNWWLEASDAAPKTPAAGTALWRALAAMPRIADVSPFTYERAVTKKWGDVSRKLYERLMKENPSSQEAKRFAVYWDFPAHQKGEEDADYSWYRQFAGAEFSGSTVFETGGYFADTEGESSASLQADLLDFEKKAGGAYAELRGQVMELKARAAGAFSSMESSFWVNFIDDLSIFFEQPDPGAEARKRYVELRTSAIKTAAFGWWKNLPGSHDAEGNPIDRDTKLREEIKTAIADPKMKPVVEYLEFLDAAVVATHFINVPFKGVDKEGEQYTYRARDYPLLARMMADFLAKYPKSKKREAALLLQARAVYHASKPRVFKKEITWPAAARWEGGYDAMKQEMQPFDARRVTAVLDQYDREFPKGRYVSEIRDFRAAVLVRARDWKRALELTLAQLDDASKPSLHVNAGDRLGDIFAQLADDQLRADVLAALKANKKARERLGQYLNAEDDTNPLLYMKSWLREQIGGGAKAPR